MPEFFANLGPGLVTGAADDDPSGISTYSVAGAAFGYSFADMVAIALDAVEASWLDPGDQAVLRRQINDAAAALRTD